VIYEGTVRHRRFAVREHTFSHRVAFAYTELDHPPAFVPHTGGPVRKLTLPRRFGKAFNPVSFYYCFDPQEELQAVVAEVTSTPWGERHPYVLRRTGDGPVLSGEFAKELHVSPFMGMGQTYRWRVATPGDTVSVHIESYERSTLVFDATLNLRRAPDGRSTTTPWRVLALIYGHGLALRLKGVPVHPHPRVAA
jgi:DUF1365 family protein